MKLVTDRHILNGLFAKFNEYLLPHKVVMTAFTTKNHCGLTYIVKGLCERILLGTGFIPAKSKCTIYHIPFEGKTYVVGYVGIVKSSKTSNLHLLITEKKEV